MALRRPLAALVAAALLVLAPAAQSAPAGTFFGDPIDVTMVPWATGEPFPFHGALFVMDGEVARGLGGAEIAVSVRAPGASGSVPSGTVVTDGDGRFSIPVDLTPQHYGTWVIEAEYAGDSDHGSATMYGTPWIAPIATTLTIAPATGTDLRPGETVAVSGTLADAGGPLGGEPVGIAVDGPGADDRTDTLLTTAADGSWRFVTDPLAEEGSWDLSVMWDGDDMHTPRTASMSVAVQRVNAVLSLAASRTTISIGGETTLEGRLSAWHTNDTVSVYGRPAGGDRRPIATVAVDDEGRFAFPVRPKVTTDYQVRYAGDDWHTAATSVERRVRVRVDIALVAVGSRAGRGGERLYTYRKSCFTDGSRCPILGAGVAPDHDGRPVTFTFQRHTRSGWKLDGRAPVRLNGRSVAAIAFRYGPPSSIVGKRWRVRVSLADHADHQGATSDWVAFRVTR